MKHHRLFPLALGLALNAQAQLIPATHYLAQLPPLPLGRACPDAQAPRDAFATQWREAQQALNEQIAKREKVLKDVRSRDLQTMQQAQLGTPGEGGVDGETMKGLSREERRKRALQMAEQRHGISAAEIDKLRQMQRSGNTAGLAGWGQALSAEQQAAAQAQPAQAAQAQQGALQVARLAARQAELAQALSRAQANTENRLQEVAQNPAGLELLARLAQRRQMAERASTCEARVDLLKSIYREEQLYCAQLAPRHLGVLNDARQALSGQLAEHDELDRIQAEIQQLQHGIKPAAEQQGLSALKAVRNYITLMGSAYRYELHGERPRFDDFCRTQ